MHPGAAIRHFRVNADMGLREAAAKCGMKPVRLAKIEQCEDLPSREEWAALDEHIPGLRDRAKRNEMNDVPRRSRLDLFTPAERAIYDAALAVEAAGCDPLLTDAVNKLHEARSLVADFVDAKRGG